MSSSLPDPSPAACMLGRGVCSRPALAVTVWPAVQVEPLGGGRIENGVDQISVFGYSSAFGQAQHELTAALLRRAYPMAVITTSDMGY